MAAKAKAIDRRRGGSQLMTPAERAVADRVSRARQAMPSRGAEWYERCGELAQRLGLNAGDVMDEFDERAGIREYDANVQRADAERLAWDDVEAYFTRQTGLRL